MALSGTKVTQPERLRAGTDPEFYSWDVGTTSTTNICFKPAEEPIQNNVAKYSSKY
jgi:hypothetical protein